jgi:poly(3-hydroxybutyrate) depolymerase
MLDHGIARVTPKRLLFAGGHQPARRDLGISSLTVEDSIVPVRAVDVIKTPFCTIVELARADLEPQSNVLLVAPLSGHFPILLRDLIIGLLRSCRVYVTDWMNIRHVPAKHGSFGLDTNIAYVLDTIRTLPAGLNVIALCQSGAPALAATALLADDHNQRTPASLVLMGSPIDPLANPTGVATLLRSRPLSWFETSLIKSVARSYAGGGRRVYPAHLQLMSLWIYLTRRVSQGGELRAKVFFDDGADARRFPFFDLFTSIMDLDARFFLENTRAVFLESWFREGTFRFQGARVDLGAINKTSLLTIEGELDDIAAPGQTRAAHALCRSLADRFRHRIVVPGSGHFSLFHGNTCQRHVVPAILQFLKGGGPVKPAFN